MVVMVPYLSLSLLAHGDFVPQTNAVPGGIFELSAVTPVDLPRSVRELHAACRQLAVLRFDVVDLHGENARPFGCRRRMGAQKEGEASIVLHRRHTAILDLELECEPQ